MRVAFNGYFWGEPRTGSGQYLRRLWGALNDLPSFDKGVGEGDVFTMLLPPGNTHGGDEDDAVPTGAHSRVAISHQLPFVGSKMEHAEKMAWEVRGAGRAAKHSGAQLLHVPYLSAPAPIFRGVPTVVTAHDMIPWVLPAYSGSPVVRLYLALTAACVKRAALIVADSEASRRDVIRVLGVSPRWVHTVYLGVEPRPQYTQEAIDEMRKRLGLPERYAFYLGGFDRRKNVPLLLRAWRAALDALQDGDDGRPTLVIGGAAPQPGGIFPDVMGEAERLGLVGRGAAAGRTQSPVRFLGRVSEADKPMLMAEARLFVYPSSYEGFGLDPLEAMSVGCPVVSSSGGSLREVVGDGGLLVPPNDEAALTQTIVRAWQDVDLQAALSQRGRTRASQFTWQRTAEQTYKLYERVLRGRREK